MRATLHRISQPSHYWRHYRFSAEAILLLIAPLGLSCSSDDDPSPYSEAELVTEVVSIRPGEAFAVALRIRLDPGWHTYWQNPGDAGQPASMEWTLPNGFRAGEFQWPYPSVVEASSVVSYGYHDEVLLLTEVTPPQFMTAEENVTLRGRARWLVCSNICLPATAELDARLPVRIDPPRPHEDWSLAFSEVRKLLPVNSDEWTVDAWVDADGYVLQVVAPANTSQSLEGAHFFVSERDVLSYDANQDTSIDGGTLIFRLRKSPYSDGDITRLRGVLVLAEGRWVNANGASALKIDVAVGDSRRINVR